MRCDEILNQALKNHYFTYDDLRFNLKYKFLLNNKEYEEYLNYKEIIDTNLKCNLPLKSFNSLNIFYFKTNELNKLVFDYFNHLSNDLNLNDMTIISSNYNDISLEITSELEGTLGIEGVNTTKKKITNIIQNKRIENNNEQIILNMYDAYCFIKTKPEFNKDNLCKLYKILSYNCLNEEDKLEGYYRQEMVEIGSHNGCDIELIDDCMNSLFKYVNENINNKNYFLPFIAHYYILYIHPYIDYNGRTARMVSLWISFLMDSQLILPTFISEAINNDKANYYRAIDESRNAHNDLTYFLTYMYNLTNEYYFIYKNINAIVNHLALVGETLNDSEIYYLKRIMIMNKMGWFNYKGFIKFCGLDITKQGALKILNKLLGYNLLIYKINSKNEKVFKLNDKMIEFKYSL